MGGRQRAPADREFDLDPFRGLVALWLMGLHLCWLSEAHEPLLRLAGQAAAEAAFHVRLGVESFLVLAGFMVGHMLRPVSGEDLRLWAYFLRRCYRLLIPFWVAVLLAGADKWAVYLAFGGGRERPGPADLVGQLLLVNELVGVPEAAVGYWTLATLEQFYLLWLVALALARWGTRGGRDAAYRRAFARMGPVALGVVLASGAAFLSEGPVPLHLSRYAFYIALGFLLYGRTRLGLYRWEWRVALAALVVAAAGLLHSRLCAALVATGVMYALGRGARFPGGPVFAALRWVGRRSYSVYLVHAVLGMRLLTGYRFVAGYGDWAAVPLVVLAAAASLAGAALFFRWVERPGQELARRVRYRAATSSASNSPQGIHSQSSR